MPTVNVTHISDAMLADDCKLCMDLTLDFTDGDINRPIFTTLVGGLDVSILQIASVLGKLKLVKYLVEVGEADIKIQLSRHVGLVELAIISKHWSTVKYLVGANAPVNAIDRTRPDVVIFAIHGLHVDTTKILLEAGSSVTAREIVWSTLPMDSPGAAERLTDILKLLIDYGIDVMELNGNGRTVLQEVKIVGRRFFHDAGHLQDALQVVGSRTSVTVPPLMEDRNAISLRCNPTLDRQQWLAVGVIASALLIEASNLPASMIYVIMGYLSFNDLQIVM